MNEQKVDPALHALRQFCSDLKQLHVEVGGESLSALSAALGNVAGSSRSNLSDVLSGKIKTPPSWELVRALLEHFASSAQRFRRRTAISTSEEVWRGKFSIVEGLFYSQKSRSHDRSAVDIGRRIEGWSPIDLGVHRPLVADRSRELPELPPYLMRAHDVELRSILANPVQSAMAVLIGWSSVGKTRAAFEAIKDSLPDWPVFHPLDAFELHQILVDGLLGPGNILWLDETQAYFQGELGQAAAVALRRILANGPEPIIVLCTIWPSYWEFLTTRLSDGLSDSHHHVRQVFAMACSYPIYVPEAVEPDSPDYQHLAELTLYDERLEIALNAAGPEGTVFQVLAGGCQLVERYEHATNPYGKAILTAAMDLYRIVELSGLSLSLLKDAALGYLSAAESPSERKLAGQRLALRHCRHKRRCGAVPFRQTLGTGAEDYRLADYLKQYGRIRRAGLGAPSATPACHA